MTALAAPLKGTGQNTKPHGIVRTWQKLVKSGQKIWEGAVVALDPSTGKWVEASADPTLVVYGRARCADYFDNTAGTNTDEMLVDSGCFLYTSSGLTDADEGKTVYVDDDQTFTLTPAATKPVMGQLVEVVSSTTGFVMIEPPSAHDGVGDDSEALTKGADLTDAAATIQLAAGQWRALPAATLTAARTLTLGTTGALAGDRMRITRLDVTGFAYTIVNGGAGAGTLAVFPGGQQGSIDAVFDGTNWALLHVGSLALDIVAGAALTDAAATIQRGGRVSWRSLAAGVLTAARTLTIGTTGAQLGDLMIVTLAGAQGFIYTLLNGGAGAGNPIIFQAGDQGFAVLYFDGTNWLFQTGATVDTDWTVGTALTDTAATTVQRAAKRTSFLLAGTMSQGEAITLGTTGALLGDVIRIIRTSTSAQTAAIVNGGAGAGTLVTLPVSKINFAEARFDGTNWLFQACGTQ